MATVVGAQRRVLGSYALLLACGVAMVVLYSFFARLQVPTASNEATGMMLRFAVFVALLVVFFIGAVLALRKIIHEKKVASRFTVAQDRMPALPPSCELAGSMVLILGFAVLFRLLLLPQTPFLSNDIYRYLWDAEVLQHGINPYLYPPEASELSNLHALEIYEKMSHKHVRTVYPPLLQGLFWLGAKLAAVLALNPIHVLKALWIVIDVLLIGVLAKILAAYKIDARWAMLYAWHPLAVIEIASSGHTDGVGAFCLLAALLMLKRERHVTSAMFLAFGFLVKFVTALLLPFLFLFSLKKENNKLNWRFAAAFFVVLVLAYAPFIAAGENLYSGLTVYSAKWRFNDALFSLVYTPLQKLFPDWLVIRLMIPPSWEITPDAISTRRIDLALLLDKGALAVVFGLIYLRMLRNTMRQTPEERMSHWPQLTLGVLTAFFLLSPTFQPWYMLWLLPLLCVGGVKKERSETLITKLRFTIYLWGLSATVFLSYWVLYAYWREGIWQEQAWVKWVEYGLPCLIFLLPARFLRRTSLNEAFKVAA